MKYVFTLSQNLPFAENPRFAALEGDKIIPDDAQFPASIDPSNTYNPRNVRAWVIGHEFGAICCVFASHAQDALDSACDKGLIDCLKSEDQNPDEESDLTPLGNASEYFDLTMAWFAPVEWDAARDIGLIVAIVRAHATGDDTL